MSASKTTGQRAHSPEDFCTALRSFLLSLPNSGQTGFEGLSAALVSTASGTALRISGAGDQAGGDAAGPDGTSRLMLEAKRYGGRAPRTADLRQKLVQAQSRGDVDLWVLATTATLSEQAVRGLARTGEQRLTGVCVIDWSPGITGLPRFCELTLAAFSAYERWCALHGHSTLDKPCLSDIELDALAAQWAETLDLGLVSFAGVAEALEHAHRVAMRDPTAAQKLFRQRLTPLSGHSAAIPRPRIHQRLERAARIALESRQILAILGEEGVGKSWAAAALWHMRTAPALLLFISARFIGPGQSVSRVFEEAIERAIGPSFSLGGFEVLDIARKRGRPVIVVIDGLNEQPSLDWGDWLGDFEREMTARGALPVVTCRPRAWASRIEPAIDAVISNVDGYDRDELARFLAANGISPSRIPDDIADGLSNPRYCRLALEIGRKSGFEGLTKDRILWRYWRERTKETRSATLNDREFQTLLIRHAEVVREKHRAAAGRLPSPVFKLRELTRWSLDEGRHPTIDAALSDIIEGRFFAPHPSDIHERYRFREDAVELFAFGLGLVQDLVDAELDGAEEQEEVIARYIDPISALDRTTGILVSAIAVACLRRGDQPQAETMVAPLISALLDLQNRDLSMLRPFCAYAADAIETYMVAAERRTLNFGSDEWMIRALRTAMCAPEGAGAITEACESWLSNCARDPDATPSRDEASTKTEEQPVGMLVQLACQVLAGFPLAALSPAVSQRAIAATVPADRTLMAWLALLDRSSPCSGSDAAAGCLSAPSSTRGRPSDDGEDEALSYCVSRFGDDGSPEIHRRLVRLPDALGSPYADAQAARYLEAGLAHLRIEERLSVLIEAPLPDSLNGDKARWPARAAWRPALQPDDPTLWITTVASKPEKLRQACHYLLGQTNFQLGPDADEVLANGCQTRAMSPGETFDEDFHAAVTLAYKASSYRAAAALSESGWGVLEEPDQQLRADASQLLALAARTEDEFDRLRGRLAPLALSTIVEHAETPLLPVLAEAFDDAIKASLSVARGEIDGCFATLDPTLGARGLDHETLNSLTRLQPFSRAAFGRLYAAAPATVAGTIERLIDAARSEWDLSGPTRYAFLMVPSLAPVAPELAEALTAAIWRREGARRDVTRARGRPVKKQEITALLALSPSRTADSLVIEAIASAPDDGSLADIARVAVVEGRVQRLLRLLTENMESRSWSDQVRAEILSATLIGARPSNTRSFSQNATRIADRYRRTCEIVNEWRTTERASRKLDLERHLFMPNHPPVAISMSPEKELEDLIAARLTEHSFAASVDLRHSLFGRAPCPDWIVGLNLRDIDHMDRPRTL